MDIPDDQDAVDGYIKKTRIETVGLKKGIVNALLAHNIRTIGGVFGRSKKELKKLLRLSTADIDELVETREKVSSKVPTPSTTPSLYIPRPPKPTITLSDFDGESDIIGTLSQFFGQNKSVVTSHTRKQEVVRVRDFIVYMLRHYGDMSYPSIGRLLNRDHTTIIHAYNKIKNEVALHPEIEGQFGPMVGDVLKIRERKLLIAEEMAAQLKAHREAMKSLGGFDSLVDSVPVAATIPDRNMKVLELYRDGLTYGEIGDVIKISRERVRQIVVWTIKQIGINESIEKGIVMDTQVLLDEESKKRQTAKDAKRELTHPKREKKPKGWSVYYAACRGCGTTTIKHLRKGLCEQCLGGFRGQLREDIIAAHEGKCDSCSRNRYEATALYGRDFYITKNREVYCKGCFTRITARKLGSYKHFDWSRLHERCKKCGTTTIPHHKGGVCEQCANATDRDRIIKEHGERCDKCQMSRLEAKSRYKKDLYAVQTGAVYCRVCFQRYAKSGMRAAKLQKQQASE